MTIERIMPQELNRLESLAEIGGAVSVEARDLRALLEAYADYDPDWREKIEKRNQIIFSIRDKVEGFSEE